MKSKLRNKKCIILHPKPLLGIHSRAASCLSDKFKIRKRLPQFLRRSSKPKAMDIDDTSASDTPCNENIQERPQPAKLIHSMNDSTNHSTTLQHIGETSSTTEPAPSHQAFDCASIKKHASRVYPITPPQTRKLPARTASVSSSPGSEKKSRSTSTTNKAPDTPSTKYDNDDDLEAKPCGSIRKGTCGSSSTYQYDQETFATFKVKVVQLCRDIGFGEPSKVEHMVGGSYNRVIGLAFSLHEGHEFVLRIPRMWDEEYGNPHDILDQVAVLRYVSQFLPVAFVSAFDSTTNNVIKSPYVLQRRVPGQNLADVYWDLPLSEKFEIIKLIADLQLKMLELKTDRPGYCSADAGIPAVSHKELNAPNIIDIVGYRFKAPGPTFMPVMDEQPITTLLVSLLEIRKNRGIEKGQGWMNDMWDKLKQITEQMKDAGLFHKNDNKCIMWHWDFALRNIMGMRQDANQDATCVKACEHAKADGGDKGEASIFPCENNDSVMEVEVGADENQDNNKVTKIETVTGKWAITGILDWDEIMAVPAILARAPPIWLWCNEDGRSSKWYENDDLMGQKDMAPARELTSDELLLKAYYEQIMQRADPNYMDVTYGRGLWIRRLAFFAINGFDSNNSWKAYEKLEADWEEYYGSINRDVNMVGEIDDEDSDTSSVHSSGSGDTDASGASFDSTSTYEYEQESFDTYRLKVIQLCRDIGFGEPVAMERMVGGSCNRVIGLSFSEPERAEYVLRIPRGPYQDDLAYNIRDQAATLLSLRQFEFLCTPIIVAVDTTTANAIGSQFVLQQRLPGKPLQDVFFDLPLSEKLEVTRVVAEHLIKMETVVLQKPGMLAGSQNLPWTCTFPTPSTSQPEVGGFRLSPVEIGPCVETQPLHLLLLKLFDIQKQTGDYGLAVVSKFDKLRIILAEMVSTGLFRYSDLENVLYQLDLCGRHILIDRVEHDQDVEDTHSGSVGGSDCEQVGKGAITEIEDGRNSTSMEDNVWDEEADGSPTEQAENAGSRWKVTGMIDWDDALSVPLILARKPQTWLWFNDEERSNTWSRDRDTPLERELTAEECAVKSRFDFIMQNADSEYMNDTYDRGVWIRRLSRFALEGFTTSEDFKRYDKFVQEWEAYYGKVIRLKEDVRKMEEECVVCYA